MGNGETKKHQMSYFHIVTSWWFTLAQMDGSIYLNDSGLQFIRDFYRDNLFLSSSSEANLFFRHIFIIIFKEGTKNLFIPT